MPPEDAMQEYIGIVTELYPSWAAGSSVVSLNSMLIFQVFFSPVDYDFSYCLVMFL